MRLVGMGCSYERGGPHPSSLAYQSLISLPMDPGAPDLHSSELGGCGGYPKSILGVWSCWGLGEAFSMYTRVGRVQSYAKGARGMLREAPRVDPLCGRQVPALWGHRRECSGSRPKFVTILLPLRDFLCGKQRFQGEVIILSHRRLP